MRNKIMGENTFKRVFACWIRHFFLLLFLGAIFNNNEVEIINGERDFCRKNGLGEHKWTLHFYVSVMEHGIIINGLVHT